MTMETEYPGLFITFEGIEGVGKSTCIKYIANHLKKKNIPYIVTREPGGTPFAEAIRQLILHPPSLQENIHPDTELLLLFAARAQHLSEVILPALRAGKWVISDRFTEASYAYQGGGRGISEKKIAMLENWVQGSFRPKLILLLDASAKKALHRTQRRKQLDRIEQEKEIFFCKVRNAYLQRAEAYPKRYCIINAAKPLFRVKQMLLKIFDPLIADYLSTEKSDFDTC